MEIKRSKFRSIFRTHLFCLTLTMLVGFLFLFQTPPRTEAEYCGWYAKLFAGGGILVNCDSHSFYEPSQNLGILFSDKHMRQSRPVYILLGKAFGLLVKALTLGRADLPYFWGYIALNFLLLDLSLVMFIRILETASCDLWLVMSAAAILACNNVSKNYLWTPHQQMLAIFTPLLVLLLTARVLVRPAPGARTAAFYGLMIGVLCLAYGNFAVMGPCLLAAMAVRYRSEGRLRVSSFGLPAALITVCAVAPTIIYIISVHAAIGRYYNHELEAYHQFIWIGDALRHGVPGLLSRLGTNSLLFIKTFVNPEVLPVPALSMAAVIAVTIRGRRGAAKEQRTPEPARPILVAAAIAVFFFLIFFWLQGYYHPRLTFTLVPPALVVLMIEIDRLAKNSLRARAWSRIIAAAAAVLWCLYHFISYGPFY